MKPNNGECRGGPTNWEATRKMHRGMGLFLRLRKGIPLVICGGILLAMTACGGGDGNTEGGTPTSTPTLEPGAPVQVDPTAIPIGGAGSGATEIVEDTRDTLGTAKDVADFFGGINDALGIGQTDSVTETSETTQ